jgi:hypothetical protein
MDVSGDLKVNRIRDTIVVLSKSGSRAASRRSPQYKGKTNISMLMIKMTFITPPA